MFNSTYRSSSFLFYGHIMRPSDSDRRMNYICKATKLNVIDPPYLSFTMAGSMLSKPQTRIFYSPQFLSRAFIGRHIIKDVPL